MMIKKRIIPVACLLLQLITFSVYAEQTPVEQLKTFLTNISAISADFKQMTLDENGAVSQQSQGKFFLSRPGQFRWDYQQPFVQQIISKAGKVWFYDADLEQVTIKKLDDSVGSTPALLLSGEADLEENYVLQQQGVDKDLLWIKLSPKNEDSGFKYILIGLHEGILAGMELSDNFGQLTRIYFSKVKINASLDDQLFDFVVPDGVDVFEN